MASRRCGVGDAKKNFGGRRNNPTTSVATAEERVPALGGGFQSWKTHLDLRLQQEKEKEREKRKHTLIFVFSSSYLPYSEFESNCSSRGFSVDFFDFSFRFNGYSFFVFIRLIMGQLKKRSEFDLRQGSVTNFPVKLEIEDEQAPLSKRFKSSPSPSNQLNTGEEFPIPPTQYNPLDEPSPLGLRLRKSPSLLDLIQMTLSQNKGSSTSGEPSGSRNSGTKKDVKSGNPSAAFDKLKASNFPASLLKIGEWEYASKHEGDLVAKCYFAKHKLVWEVLDGGLKSKIEIQWSDIMGLKANFTDNGPATLTVVLARQPLFFRETNPQPRKHTLWQAAADFTDGQASIHRQHVLHCPHGLLNKHYEKLIQCDVRLNCLSQQPEIELESPYFSPKCSDFEEDQNESRAVSFSTAAKGSSSPLSGLYDVGSPSVSQSSSLKIEQWDQAVISSERLSKEVRSPSSVMDTYAIEGKLNSRGKSLQAEKNQDMPKVPGIRPSISMNDLVNHIGNCFSEKLNSGNLNSPEKQSDCRVMLEDIAQILLSDTQINMASDEKSLMSRVNSLCCLLHNPTTTGSYSADGKDPEFNRASDEKTLMSRVNSLRCLLQDHPVNPSELVAGNGQSGGQSSNRINDNECDVGLEKSLMARVNSLQCLLQDPSRSPARAGGSESGDVSGVRKESESSHNAESVKEEETKVGAAGMSRIDSYGDLLLHLPRIASLPQFLFDISEDGEL